MGTGSDDSSEIVLGPVTSDSRSLSRCSVIVKSSVSVAAAIRGAEEVTGTEQILAKSDILGRFRIGEMLGEGQHATVYRAYDPVLERDVALKVPRQRVIRTAKGLERFLGEAKALARLRHPQIVPVYEIGCVGNRHYMAMALIEGCSLARRMAESRFEIHRATEIVAELAEALEYAHGQGVVHRDVKPANIRLDGQRCCLRDGFRHCLPARFGRDTTSSWNDARYSGLCCSRAGARGPDGRAASE